jgi:hypothetical protein
MYAYTSKGPYILDTPAWTRITDTGAKILLKKVGAESESRIIHDDIDALEAQLKAVKAQTKLAKFRASIGYILVGGGVFGAFLGVCFTVIEERYNLLNRVLIFLEAGWRAI